MVSGPAVAGSVARTDPTAKRSAGKSVWTLTTTSPRTPCDRMIRPTTSCTGTSSMDSRGGQSVRVDDVDPHPAATDRRDHLAQGLGGPPATADHGAEVVGVHPDLEPLAAPTVDHAHPDLVRVLHDALDEVFEGRAQRAVSPAGRRRHRQTPALPRRSRPARPPQPAQ